jgi:ankyrin repeat protein
MQGRAGSQATLNKDLRAAIKELDVEKVLSLLNLGADPKIVIQGSGKGSAGKEISKKYNMGKSGQEIILACYQKILDNVIATQATGTKRNNNNEEVRNSFILAAQTLKAVLAKQQTIDKLIPYLEIITGENDIALVYNNMNTLGIFPIAEELKKSHDLKTSAVPAIPEKLLASLSIQQTSTETARAVTIQSNTLAGLSRDMLVEIMSYLPPGDTARLARTSKAFALAAESNLVWKHKVERYYPEHFENLKHAELIAISHSNQFDWKSIFKEFYLTEPNELSKTEKIKFNQLTDGNAALAQDKTFVSFMHKMRGLSNARRIFLRLHQSDGSQTLLNTYYDRAWKSFAAQLSGSPSNYIGTQALESAIMTNQPFQEIKRCLDTYAFNYMGLTDALSDVIFFDRREVIQSLLQHHTLKRALTTLGNERWLEKIFNAAAKCRSLETFKLIEDQIKSLFREGGLISPQENLTKLFSGIKDKDDMTLMHWAVLFNNLELVKHLKETHKMDVNIVNAQGISLLEMALKENKNFSHISMIMYLLEVIDINNPLYKARYLPLINKKDSPYFFQWMNHYNTYFAHRAVAGNNRNLLVSLANNGFPAHVLDDQNNTLLHAAAAGNHVDLMKHLIHLGIAIDSVNIKGETPLHFAAKHGASEAVALLLEHRANKLATNAEGRTPLYMAAFIGKEELIEKLWFDEAKNQLDGHGQSALYAAVQGYLEACKTNGSRYSVTPYLSLRVQAGDANTSMLIIDKLIAKQANVNACSKENYETLPLSLAAASKDTGLVKKLLDAGAIVPDMLVHDRKNTPLSMIMGGQSDHWMLSEGSQEIMKMLLCKLLDDYIHSPAELRQRKQTPKPEELLKNESQVENVKKVKIVKKVKVEDQPRLDRCLNLANMLRKMLNGVAPTDDSYENYNDIIKSYHPSLFQIVIYCMETYRLMPIHKDNVHTNTGTVTSTVTSTNTTGTPTPLMPDYSGTITFNIDDKTRVFHAHPSVTTPTSTLLAAPQTSALSQAPESMLFGTAASTATPISTSSGAPTRAARWADRRNLDGNLRPVTGGLTLLGAVKRPAESDPDATESDSDDDKRMDARQGPKYR